MNIMNDKYSITAFYDGIYSENSADNRPYDFKIYTQNFSNVPYTSYRITVEKFDSGNTVEIIVIGSYCSQIEYNGMLLNNDTLFILMDLNIVILSLYDMSYNVQNIPHPFGTYYSIYLYESNYIIYGELEIIMLDSSFNDLWRYCTQDILFNANYSLKVENGYILFYDWDGNLHKLDLNGKLCDYIEHEPTVIKLDLTNIDTPKELQEIIRKNFSVPNYYRENWDAFWDFITEIMPDMLILEGWHIYKSKQFKDAEIFENILNEYNKQYGSCKCIYY